MVFNQGGQAVQKVSPGDPLAISARSWNAIADAVNGGVSQSGPPGFPGWMPTVLVRNELTERRRPFECVGLDGLVKELRATQRVDPCFKADTIASDRAFGILAAALPYHASRKYYSRVYLSGVCLAWVGPGTGRYANPDAANYRLAPADFGPVELLQPPDGAVAKLLPVLIGGSISSGSKIALASTGVPARAGAAAGSATVTEYKLVGSTLTSNSSTFTAYNLDPKAIPSGQYVLCVQEQLSSRWIVQHPGIVDLRYTAGRQLQYTYDGVTWVTWTTAGEC